MPIRNRTLNGGRAKNDVDWEMGLCRFGIVPICKWDTTHDSRRLPGLRQFLNPGARHIFYIQFNELSQGPRSRVSASFRGDTAGGACEPSD